MGSGECLFAKRTSPEDFRTSSRLSLGGSMREKKDSIRSLPFFFSTGFFVLFGAVSILLIPFYLYRPSSILVPLGLDGLLLIAALTDYLIGPSPKQIEIERPLPYPLTVKAAASS